MQMPDAYWLATTGMHNYCTDPEGNWFGLLQPEPRS